MLTKWKWREKKDRDKWIRIEILQQSDEIYQKGETKLNKTETNDKGRQIRYEARQGDEAQQNGDKLDKKKQEVKIDKK